MSLVTPTADPAGSPFHLEDDAAFRRWSDAKLARYPADLGELVVEVKDPRRLTRTGPVFRVDPVDGTLHMRHTARRRNAVWKDDPPVRAAARRLHAILEGSEAGVLRGLLQAGMGLISNNVLHDRAAFEDDPESPRLLYRARFYDRLDI